MEIEVGVVGRRRPGERAPRERSLWWQLKKIKISSFLILTAFNWGLI
jgi:hypothetical protein